MENSYTKKNGFSYQHHPPSGALCVCNCMCLYVESCTSTFTNNTKYCLKDSFTIIAANANVNGDATVVAATAYLIYKYVYVCVQVFVCF